MNRGLPIREVVNITRPTAWSLWPTGAMAMIPAGRKQMIVKARARLRQRRHASVGGRLPGNF